MYSVTKTFVLAILAALVQISCCEVNVFEPIDTRFSRHSDAVRYAEEGRQLAQQKKYEEAMAHFTTALSLDTALGEARLGLAKAAIARYRTDFRQIGLMIASDTIDSIVRDTLTARLLRWSLGKIDSVYISLGVAFRALEPMFFDGFLSSDGFRASWIATDYCLVYTSHMVMNLHDSNDDGRVTEVDRLAFPIRIKSQGGSYTIEGLDRLSNDSIRVIWEKKADMLVKRIPVAMGLFRNAFGQEAATQFADQFFSRAFDILGAAGN